MDPSDVPALVRIKYLVRLTDYILLERSAIAASFGTVLCDAAVESTLRLVLERKLVKVATEEFVPTLLEKARGKLSSPNLRLSDMARLHEARNKVLHQRLLIDETEARTLCALGESGMSELVRLGLGVDWQSISIAELFADPVVRELYARAERALSGGNLSDAIISLVACFEVAKTSEQERIYGSGITIAGQLAKFASSMSTNPDTKAIFDYVEAVHKEVEVLKLRLDYKEYRKYADVAPTILTPAYQFETTKFSTASEAFTFWNGKLGSVDVGSSGSAEWARFAIRFVEQSVLTWQSVPRAGWADTITTSMEAWVDSFTSDWGKG